jgi:hypothetical protein
MSPDLLFALSLAVKMAVAALFVITATVTAERAGPTIGALIATLPVSAGPAYVFLALDHDRAFIAASALTSLSINVVTALFALTFVFVAQKGRLLLSVGVAAVVWIAFAFLMRAVALPVSLAALANILVFPACHIVARPFRHVAIPRLPLRVSDYVIRGLGVASLVAAVVTLSAHIGPQGSGMLAVFPVVYTSIMVILHARIGGKAAAAVIASGFLGLFGFGAAMLTLHLLVVPLGAPAALTLALAVSMAWNMAIYGLHRRKRRVV